MGLDIVLQFFAALFAIINPLGKIPIWAKLSGKEDESVRRPLTEMIVATAAAVLLVTLFFGKHILGVFGIDMASFRIGGGIVILLFGLAMLNGNLITINVEDTNEENRFFRIKKRFHELAVPVATPLIAGPGAISTVLIYANQSQSFFDSLYLAAVVVLVMAGVMLVLMWSNKIQAFLGETTLEVATRIFGLILTAIAAQLIVEGLAEVFPQWIDQTSPLFHSREIKA
ncbi:MAG: MarC family protein [Candidatus Omnitrophota bacterium]